MIRSPAPVVVACALVLGCATAPAPREHEARSATAQPAALPAAAYIRGDTLFLRYSIEGRPLDLSAAWPAAHAGPPEHQYRAAALDVFDGPETEVTELPRTARPVLVRSRDEWDVLVRDLLTSFAPEDPREAIAIAVQGEELLLGRDAAGALRIWRFDEKPPGVRVARGVSDYDFAARATRLARERRVDGGPVLFASGDAEGAASFVLFDFDRNLSVFVAAPPSPDPGGAAPPIGFSVRFLGSVVLQGQVLAVLKGPFSSAARLLTLAGHSGVELVTSLGFLPDAPPPPLSGAAPMDLAVFEAKLDELTGERRYPGRIRFLVDGTAYFPALVRSIEDAKRSIDVRVYIFDVDDYAIYIADLLKARSKDVPVRVLLDDMATLVAGHLAPPSPGPGPAGARAPGSIEVYLRRDSQVEVRARPNPWLTGDHTKTIIFDGRVAYLGGMNIGREYRFDWHDLMIEVEGPVVARFERDFAVAWRHAGLAGDLAMLVAAVGRERGGAVADAEPGEAMLRPLYTATARPEIYVAQLAAIREARHSIWIQNAYLADNTIANELVRARRRGVDVRVILPTAGDSRFMNASNLVTASYLLRNGVRVFAYPGMTHVKAAIFDGWACFGSANFDKMSLKINLETNLATSDPDAVGRLRAELFEPDFRRSRELTGTRPLGFADYFSEFVANQL